MHKRKKGSAGTYLRKKKAVRRRPQKRDRHGPTLGEDYGPLIKWVAFINNPNEGAIPGAPPFSPLFAQSRIRSIRAEVLDGAHAFLRKLKDAIQDGFPDIEGPPSRFTIVDNRLQESGTEGTLVAALIGRDLNRLRVCLVCRKLFVALNFRSRTCGAVCSNRQSAKDFYSRHREAVQKRNREKYHEDREREERLSGFLRRDRRRD